MFGKSVLLMAAFAAAQFAGLESICFGATKPAGERREVSLDGIWEVAESGMDAVPKVFGHKIPVPGLADMAKPKLTKLGQVGGRTGEYNVDGKDARAFWYRRSFTLEGDLPEHVLLKINKAKFGVRVFINGKIAGESNHSFTPVTLDIRPFLKPAGEENEIIIRVGLDWACVPSSVIVGFDKEKRFYLSGIYDSVKLILTGSPFIRKLQIAPGIESKRARVVVDMEKAGKIDLAWRVLEAVKGKVVSEGKADSTDFFVDVPDCRLWSPEDPFLYRLEVTSVGDGISTRFGMRSFRMDGETGRAILNGKPYFLRGSNVCIYRFFEDTCRKDLPWRASWVREFHEKVRSMNWNSLRYCIGFPPEIWYDIADELGILIQDEYPVWGMRGRKGVSAKSLAAEYREWMEERWNHPCVVIWDAQNETRGREGKVTGPALEMVRALDLSNRPWDNGEAAPQRPGDTLEAHPYKFTRIGKNENKTKWKAPCDPLNPYSAPFRGKAKGDFSKNPIIINEYGWIWLLRDGTPSLISQGAKIYKGIETAEERRYLGARAWAAKSEYWRSHRQCAGVLHFCALTCSKSIAGNNNFTSDNFINLDPLTFEPHFEKLVRDAFAPVGIMLDFWETSVKAGSKHTVKIAVINDLYEDWKGPVDVRIEKDGKEVWKGSVDVAVKSLGRTESTIEVVVPGEAGDYLMIAGLKGDKDQRVESIRDLAVKGSKTGKPQKKEASMSRK